MFASIDTRKIFRTILDNKTEWIFNLNFDISYPRMRNENFTFFSK